MSRFNAATKSAKLIPDATNRAGGEAFTLPIKIEAASLVLNAMLNGKVHESGDAELARVKSVTSAACKAGHAEFMAKLALYARHTHGLRSVSHVIGVQLALDKAMSGKPWAKRFYERLAYRPDDITEVLSLYGATNSKRHPNAMTRGFAKALMGFDDYRLAKYKGAGRTVNLMDAVNICHPKAGKDSPIGRLIRGELKPADTWETNLSKAGKVVEAAATDEAEAVTVEGAKADVWKTMLEQHKLGYLALLRNIRNIVNQAPDAVDLLCAALVNEKALAKAKIFPFQLATAYKVIGSELSGHPKGRQVIQAIHKAVDLALANVPRFAGATLVVVDDSGSMTSGQVQGANSSCIDIAALFAAVLMKANPGADYMQFGSDARYTKVDFDGQSILSARDAIVRLAKSGSTNFSTIFAEAKRKYDRVIILSDMQGWVGGSGDLQGSLRDYKRRFDANPFLYSFDLAGHGTAMFPADRVATIAGWSEKVFDVMGQLEQDRDALVKTIEAFAI